METLNQLRGLLGNSNPGQNGIVMRADGHVAEVATGNGLVTVQTSLPVKAGDQVTISHGAITRIAAPPSAETWFV